MSEGLHIEHFEHAVPELVKSIRQGDADAFEVLYRMEYLNLVHFTDSYLKDTEKARDISQESLMALWENRRRLNPSGNIRAYLFTIARNKTLDELSRRIRFVPTEEAAQALALLEDHAVEEYIGALELRTLMEKVWRSLPEKIGNTFSMSREEGLKNREIALQEGVSEKAVEYRIKVALARFKENLEKFLG